MKGSAFWKNMDSSALDDGETTLKHPAGFCHLASTFAQSCHCLK